MLSVGEVPEKTCPLETVLEIAEAKGQIFSDPIADCSLRLLHVLFTLNEYWWRLYEEDGALSSSLKPVIDKSFFVSQKLTAKAYRFTSDFIRVVTQQSDQWAHKLAFN